MVLLNLTYGVIDLRDVPAPSVVLRYKPVAVAVPASSITLQVPPRCHPQIHVPRLL